VSDELLASIEEDMDMKKEVGGRSPKDGHNKCDMLTWRLALNLLL
jgi:hypothetical protein